MKAALLALAATACSGQRWLERDVPASCRDDFADCRAWAEIEARWRSVLAVYDERGVTAYVQGVADRLIDRSRLAIAPRIVLLDTRQGAAMVSARSRVLVRRDVLAALGSEAELAAMLAHELVHVRAHHVDNHATDDELEQPTWVAGRVDDEAVADEAAVGLLVGAGYPAPAMLDMMRALDRMAVRESPELAAGDAEHPPIAVRLARIAAVIATYPPGGDDRRAIYLRHLDGLVMGTDLRQGVAIGDAWVAIDPGFALATTAWQVTTDRAVLYANRGGYATELAAVVVSGPWARLLASRLRDRRAIRAAGRAAIRGVMPADFDRPYEQLTPRDRVLEASLADAWRPVAGAEVAVLDTGADALVIVVSGQDSAAILGRVLRTVRAATAADRAAVRPARIAIRPAAVAGGRDAVVLATCAGFASSRDLYLDDATFGRGEPVRCLEPGAP